MSAPRVYFKEIDVDKVDGFWRGERIGTIVMRGRQWLWRSFLKHDGKVGDHESDLQTAKNRLSEHVRLWSEARSVV